LKVTADTHVIIWDALEPEKLSKNARIAFDQANESEGIIFCDISLWEISMLLARKRFEIDATFLEFIEILKTTRNYIFQTITPEIADFSTKLSSDINSDPADRLISATSIFLNTALITADQNLRNSKSIQTIW